MSEMSNKPAAERSDADWQAELTPEQYRVCRKHGTEAPFSGAYWNTKAKGMYLCACCGQELFHSETKFDSGTGWPSFYTVIRGAVATQADYAMGVRRTEYHCARCLGHQGHVFDDGPRPTGLRYCNNGVALTFRPA